MGHLGPRKVYPHNSGSSVGIALQFLHNERGQERYGNYIIGFSEKNLIQAIWLYWPKIGKSS